MEKRLIEPHLGIVTINYLNWRDTVEMVKSLQKQSFQSFHLVIVDNHSGNGSFQKLSEFYSDNLSIWLLLITILVTDLFKNYQNFIRTISRLPYSKLLKILVLLRQII